MSLNHFRARHFAAQSMITLGSLVSETGAYLKRWFVRRKTAEDSKESPVVSARARKIIEAVAREQADKKLSDSRATALLRERLESAYIPWKPEYFQLLVITRETFVVLVENHPVLIDNRKATAPAIEDDEEVIVRMLFEFA